MADEAFVVGGGGAGANAPLGYSIPGTGEIVLKGAFARLDGTSAGAFLPCLRIKTPNGTIMYEIVGTSVAGGGAADVTWFPGIGTQEATNPVVSNQLDYVENATTVTVPYTSLVASPTTVITSDTIAFDGLTRVRLEFYAYVFDLENTGEMRLDIWDNTTNLGTWGQVDLETSPAPPDLGTPLYLAHYYTPPAGSHTFTVKAYQVAPPGTGNAFVGSSSSTAPGFPNPLPMWLRVSV